MIICSMNLVSAISPNRDCTLVTIVITNDGTGTGKHGNYNYEIKGRKGQSLRCGHIEHWPRANKTACALLQRVINDAYPKG